MSSLGVMGFGWSSSEEELPVDELEVVGCELSVCCVGGLRKVGAVKA